jgi:hypothetical protein
MRLKSPSSFFGRGKKVKIIVTGGRFYKNYSKVVEILDGLKPSFIIQGGCSGADSLAVAYSEENKIKYKTYEANWSEYGVIAGPIRNKKMLEENLDSVLVAFPGGRGTENCVKTAQQLGVKVIFVS